MSRDLEVSNATRTDHEELRSRILEASMKILRNEGNSGLSLRRVASKSDTSTQMIYTIFGGKDALVEAIYDEASDRLLDRFESISSDQSPILRLYQMGSEYRRYALENRALYEAMYSSRLSDEEVVKKTEVFELFREAVTDCLEAGLSTNKDPSTITEAFWAAAHGAIGLELSGYYDSKEAASEAYDETMRAVFDGYRIENPTEIPD